MRYTNRHILYLFYYTQTSSFNETVLGTSCEKVLVGCDMVMSIQWLTRHEITCLSSPDARSYQLVYLRFVLHAPDGLRCGVNEALAFRQPSTNSDAKTVADKRVAFQIN